MLNQAVNNPAAAVPQFATTISTAEIDISPTAAERFRALLKAADQPFSGIRIFVMGGGCGGMSYSMTYAEDIGPFDTVLHGDDYTLVVDSVALNYLQGCSIDFARQGANESFVFKDVFQSVGGSGGCAGCGASGGGAY
jgi:iron-sulfur cluster assembly accessory protein